MSFFALLFIFQLVLMNYSKSILQNILNLQFEMVTDGKYTSSFDDIEVSYTEKSLTIKNLLLVPKDYKDKDLFAAEGYEEAYLLSVFIPEVKLSDINLRKAYLQNYLEIGSLELDQPKIKVKANFDDSLNSSSGILKKDLYTILPSNIEEFRIGTVRIIDGTFDINGQKNQEENNIHIAPFQMELSNFHINEKNARQTDKIFFMDNFFIEADNIKGHLQDEKYGLDVESLKVSSFDSSAFARKISLKPRKEIDQFDKDNSISNIYEIDFPQVYIYGLSFNDLYNSRDLIATEVTILSPEFQLINLKDLNPGQKENFKLENLYPVIDKVLNSIQVKNLHLRNGKVKINEFNDSLQEKLSSDILMANIRNFVLDSASGKNDQKLLFSEQINFKLKNYSLKLSDNLHFLQAQELNFSSGQSEISATGFRIIPDTENNSVPPGKNTFYAIVPSIRLHGVDMLNAYNNNILNIDSIGLRQPSFSLLRHGKDKVSSPSAVGAGFHEEDLYALIEDYLYSLNINKIALNKGKINIRSKRKNKEGTFITNIRNASLWQFRLDSTSAYQMNKLFYANDFEIEIENYDHVLPDDLHRITADEIGISTLKDRIYISDLKIFATEAQFPYSNLHATQAKNIINLEVPFLELDEVDILKAYLHKRLEVGSVKIPSPSIQLGTILGNQSERTDLIKSSAIYDLMKDFLEVIKVRDLHLQNGQLDLAFYAKNEPLLISGRNTDILVHNFRFDSLTSSNPKRLFFADNVRVQVEDFTTHLADGIHIISAENLLASTEAQEVLAEEVKISTLQNNYSEAELIERYGQKGYFNLQLPLVQLKGINFDRAYYEEHLQIDSVVAREPNLRYTYLLNKPGEKKKKRRNLRDTDFYSAISPFFAALEIESLILEDGSFSAVQLEDGKYLESTLLEGISLRMENYLLDSAANQNSDRFFFADDIRINIDKYQQELLDKIHTLSARNLSLSTASQNVKAEDIRLKPDSKKLQQFNNLISTSFKNRFNIFLPNLQINGIGFDEVYRNGNLKIKELILQNPDISIRHQVHESISENGKEKKSLTQYDLDELIKGNLKSLEIKTSRILHGQGNYTRIAGLAAPFQIEAEHFDAHIYNLKIGGKKTNQDKLLNADDVKIFLTDFERKLPDSLHLLKVKELTISTMRNEVEVIGAELVPRWDTDLLQKLELKGQDRLFHLKLPLNKISGIDIDLLQKDSLSLQNILVDGGELQIYQYPHLSEKKKLRDKNSSKLSEQLFKSFKTFQSDSVTLKNGIISFVTVDEQQDSSSFKLGNINGLATNFKIDSSLKKENDRLFFSDRLQLGISDYSTTLDNELYQLKIGNASIDTQTRDLVVDSISITPMVSRNTFAKTKGYETDQFTFRNKKLKVENLDLVSLMEGDLIADSLLLDGMALHLYRDKRQPKQEKKDPKMPQERLREMNTYLLIKGVAISNGYIGYEEQAKGARGTGFIDLTNIQIVSDTITNDSLLLANGLTTNIKLESMLMGTGLLNAFFEIPLGDSLNSHTFYGSLDEMSLPDFNPILEKTVFVKIRDGHADHIKFFVEADKNLAKGTMDFKYSGLKVALVNKKTGKTGGPIKELGSLLANWLVVNTNNTGEEDKPFLQGDMYYERDENRSTVNYWVKTLVNGFKSSIGM